MVIWVVSQGMRSPATVNANKLITDQKISSNKTGSSFARSPTSSTTGKIRSCQATLSSSARSD